MFDPINLARAGGDGVSVIDCRPRDDVYYQGDPADAIYLVRAGQFKLSAVYPTGRLGIIAVARSGDFFGETCLRGERYRMYTASAITEGSLLRITRSRAEHLLREHPEFAAQFIQYLLMRNRRLEGRLLNHLFSSSEARLARVLFDLASAGDGKDSQRIVPKPSHEMLAALVGTTRPRISGFMRQFRERGFVSAAGNVLEVRRSLWNVIQGDAPQARRSLETRSATAPRLVERASCRLGGTT
jgi:CRP-like cAMP-binding protein